MHAPLSGPPITSPEPRFSPGRRRWLGRWLGVPLSAPLVALLMTACGGGGGPGRPLPPADSPDYGPARRDAARKLLDALATPELAGAGVSIALIDGADTVWAEGFGVARASAGWAAAPGTRYEAASITKLFTATAVMQLVQDKRVDLDLPIDRYIPGFRIRSRWDLGATPITARLLLTHRSGIPEQLLVGGYADRSLTLAETTALLAEETLAHPPGTLRAYSNLGYEVLGRLIECVSGIPYARYVEEKILQPLGMDGSAMRDPAEQTPPGIALADGVGYPAQEDVAPRWLDNGIADGGLRSTVEDLAKFASACLRIHAGTQLNGVPLQAASLAEMWRVQFSGQAADLDLDDLSGLGWSVVPLKRDTANGRELRAVMHGGTSMHHRSILALLPEQGLGVVVLCNHSGSSEFIQEVALTALVDAAQIKARTVFGPLASPVAPAHARHRDLGSYEGYYVLRDGPVVRLHLAAGALLAEISGEQVGVLTPGEDGFLWAKSPRQDPERVALEQVRGLELLVRYSDDGRRSLFASRIAVPPQITPEWRARIGTYALLGGQRREIIHTARLFMTDDDILRLKLAAPTFSEDLWELGLAPDTPGTALILGVGRGRQETVRGGRDRQGDFITVLGITLHRVAESAS